LPSEPEALAWLAAQGLADAAPLLAVAGGNPLQAQVLAQEGVDASRLAALPARVAAGDASPLAGLGVPRALELLQKLAHDLACVAAGAAPRYLPSVAQLPAVPAAAVQGWQASLLRAARHAQHPWNAGLLVEALVTEAAALWPAAAQRRPGRGLHSAA
jgi:DNA polymerase-3 subunit delta'